MTVRLENMPALKIAYMRRIGPYGSDNKDTMERMKAWARVHGLLDENAVVLGIAQDNPQTTRPGECRYDTCLILNSDIKTKSEDIKFGSVPGGSYCVFEIEHTAEALQKAWQEIFPELAKLKYEPDYSRPILERYSVKMVNAHKCEICVPVQNNAIDDGELVATMTAIGLF